MKTEEEIRGRIRELVTIELKRRLDEAHARLPHLCNHNYRHALDTRKAVCDVPNENYNRIKDVRHLPLAQTMGLCMLGSADPETWRGTICDDPIDAQRCPVFEPRHGNDAMVTTEFADHVKDPAWVEANLPVIAALLWVAGDPEPIREKTESAPDTDPTDAPLVVVPPKRPSWWNRLWNWFDLVGLRFGGP